jgi:hypothetical protein
MYSKEEIIKFFISAVNPALTDFGTVLRGYNWEVDLQTHDPYFEFSDLDNKLWTKIQPIDKKIWSKIDATKQDGPVPKCLFSYQILAESTGTNQNSCLLKVTIMWKNELNDGKCNETYNPDNISSVTKNELLKRMKIAYDNYRRMI